MEEGRGYPTKLFFLSHACLASWSHDRVKFVRIWLLKELPLPT